MAKRAYTQRGIVYDPEFLRGINEADPRNPWNIEKMSDRDVILVNRETHHGLTQEAFEALIKFDKSEDFFEDVIYFKDGKPFAWYNWDASEGFIS